MCAAKQVGDFDLVILAQTLHERIALMAQVGRFQLALMDILLVRAPFVAGILRLLREANALGAFAFAVFD